MKAKETHDRKKKEKKKERKVTSPAIDSVVDEALGLLSQGRGLAGAAVLTKKIAGSPSPHPSCRLARARCLLSVPSSLAALLRAGGDLCALADLHERWAGLEQGQAHMLCGALLSVGLGGDPLVLSAITDSIREHGHTGLTVQIVDQLLRASAPPAAASMARGLDVAEVPGRGLGVVARVPVAAGAVLLVAEPFAVARKRRGKNAGGGMGELVQAVIRRGKAAVRESVLSLAGPVSGDAPEPAGQVSKALLDLVRAPDCDPNGDVVTDWEALRICLILERNTFGLVDPWEATADSFDIALFPEASRFNHSCDPNATFYSVQGGLLVVRAVRAVAAGEEVTISYVPAMTPRPVRQGALLERYGFLCECARCTEEPRRVRDDELEAMVCADCGCPGLLPLRRISVKAKAPPILPDWICSGCKMLVPHDVVAGGLAAFVSRTEGVAAAPESAAERAGRLAAALGLTSPTPEIQVLPGPHHAARVAARVTLAALYLAAEDLDGFTSEQRLVVASHEHILGLSSPEPVLAYHRMLLSRHGKGLINKREIFQKAAESYILSRGRPCKDTNYLPRDW